MCLNCNFYYNIGKIHKVQLNNLVFTELYLLNAPTHVSSYFCVQILHATHNLVIVIGYSINFNDDTPIICMEKHLATVYSGQ